MTDTTDTTDTTDEIVGILESIRERGGRVTVPRRVIIARLLAAAGHLTAEELAEAVQESHADIHLSTVYRCLDTLSDLGVIEHVHLGHGPAVYHLVDRSHAHLVCESCGVVVTLPDEILEGFRTDVEAALDFVPDLHHFAVMGTCRGCR